MNRRVKTGLILNARLPKTMTMRKTIEVRFGQKLAKMAKKRQKYQIRLFKVLGPL
jgi:hypothetical protein